MQARTRLRSAWVLAGVVLACSGCAGLPAAAQDELRQAHSDYQAGRYRQAQARLDTVIRGFPRHQGMDEAFYLRGLCMARQQQNEEARADLTKALKSTHAEVLGRAQAQLGHLAYEDRDFARAVEHYREALKHVQGTSTTNEVYYQYGDSLQKVGAWATAWEILPKVWYYFPEAANVHAARHKFSWPHDYFTIQCGAFGDVQHARALAQQLRTAEFDVTLEVDVRQKPPVHKVYIGRYPCIASAEEALERTRAQVKEARIVP